MKKTANNTLLEMLPKWCVWLSLLRTHSEHQTASKLHFHVTWNRNHAFNERHCSSVLKNRWLLAPQLLTMRTLGSDPADTKNFHTNHTILNSRQQRMKKKQPTLHNRVKYYSGNTIGKSVLYLCYRFGFKFENFMMYCSCKEHPYSTKPSIRPSSVQTSSFWVGNKLKQAGES
jgi:hypothetical protein